MDDFLGIVKEQATKARTNAVKIGKQMYEKTNTAIAVTKLSIAVNETDSKIKEVYESIGRSVYGKYLEGKSDEDTQESCAALDELFKELETLKEKKAELKESVKCSECGAYNKNDAAYCSKCGAKLEGKAAAEEDVCEVSEEADTEVIDQEESGEEPAQESEPEEAADEETESVINKVKKVITIKAKKPAED